jgi:hypothetical protein
MFEHNIMNEERESHITRGSTVRTFQDAYRPRSYREIQLYFSNSEVKVVCSSFDDSDQPQEEILTQ